MRVCTVLLLHWHFNWLHRSAFFGRYMARPKHCVALVRAKPNACARIYTTRKQTTNGNWQYVNSSLEIYFLSGSTTVLYHHWRNTAKNYKYHDEGLGFSISFPVSSQDILKSVSTCLALEAMIEGATTLLCMPIKKRKTVEKKTNSYELFSWHWGGSTYLSTTMRWWRINDCTVSGKMRLALFQDLQATAMHQQQYTQI